jgi:hypothetical protein
VVRLPEKDREILASRIAALNRDRELLVAQAVLYKAQKVEVPHTEAVVLKPAPWGKDGKGKALAYESTYFKLVSNASEDIVQLTAIQLEEVFSAYARCLPPREGKSDATTILLTHSMAEYQELLTDLGRNILNPAFYDRRANQVVCGSDLGRLREEVKKVKEEHGKLRIDLEGRQKELRRIYNGMPPDELTRPIKDAFAQIAAVEKKNEDVLQRSHDRLVKRLCHEAFHAYLTNAALPGDSPRAPTWLDEGLAQIFETAPVEGGELRLGCPDRRRLERVKEALGKGELLSLATLLRSGPRHFQFAQGDAKQVSDQHYLAAWGLAFYLTFERQLLGTPAMEDYLKSLARGTDPLEAFSALVKQPLGDFEKEMRHYLDNLREDGTVATAK